MSRIAKAEPRAPRKKGTRLGVEALERREVRDGGAAVAFLSAFGLGSIGRYSTIHANAVATDAAGDTFLTGSFRGTVAFDPASAASTFTTGGTQDAFVAEYSPSGALKWARTFAGQATAAAGGTTTYAVGQGSAIAVDGSGKVFVAGSFSGTVNFGPGSARSSPGGSEAFVARLDPSGNLAWVSNAVANGGDDSASAIALDGSGGAVIAGSFAQGLSFGPFALSAGGASEAFAARVDSGGHFAWATASQGTAYSNAGARGVAVDPSGNVALSGFFSGHVSLIPGGPGLDSAGSNDAAVWKLDPSGHPLWARSFGSADYDSADAVAIDASGGILVAGTFSGTVNFATGSSPDALTAGPIFDAYVLKLDPAGNEAWARGFVGPGGWARATGIALDAGGNVDVAGTFSGKVDFDPGPSTMNLTSGGSTDAFVAGLDTAGNFVYALQAGQANANSAEGVAANASGSVAIAGSYSGTIAFGATTLPSAGPASIFVARAIVPPRSPAAPSAPILEAASTTGALNTTSIASPVFDVTSADPSDTVELARDGVVVGQRVGPGAIRDPGPVTEGSHTYTAFQVTPGGGGPSGPGVTVSFLLTPPSALAAPTLLAADDSGVVGDGITRVRQPHLVGIAPANDAVQVVNAAGSVLGSAVATSGGAYSVLLSAPLGDGSYSLSVRAIDDAANVGAPSPALALKILSAPPAAPSAPSLLAQDDSGAVGDGITNARQPRLVVAGPAGLTIQVVNPAGVILGSASAPTGGSYTVPIAKALADGLYSLRAVAIDAAGNASPAGGPLSLLILATPPSLAAPGLLAADDTGAVGDGLTTVKRPRLVGSGVPGGKVSWIGPDGSTLATTTASTADGSYTLQLPTASPNGLISARVREVDLAGNVGPISSPFALTIRAAAGDYFGDARTDVAIFRPADLAFYIQVPATGALYAKPWAIPGDVPVAGDFFGDGHSDVAVYRPSTSTFYLFNPATNAVAAIQWGAPGAIPVPADYFGDGKADVAIFWPSNATFFVLDSFTNALSAIQFGIPGDIPVPADYFGNGHADIAVYRPSNGVFYIFDPITGAFKADAWGAPGDIPMPADYFGDGHADVAVYRPGSIGTYLIQTQTATAPYVRAYGIPGDVPVTGDYFGAGHANLAVYRPSISTFFAFDPVTNAFRTFQWGVPNIEKPILPTITAQFHATGTPAAISAFGGPSTPRDVGPIVGPIAADPATPIAPAKKSAAVDRAIGSLSLERWRFGA